jgi:hypothetical protein
MLLTEKVFNLDGFLTEIIMKNRCVRLLSVLLIALSFVSCKKNHYKVNTSRIDVNIEVRRLEKDLFELDPGQIASSVPALKLKYGNSLQLFSYVINTGDINDPAFPDFLVRFCTDKQNNEVYASVMKVFPDVSVIRRDIEDAFRHYLYYFPGRRVPEVFTCITGFNNSIITGDSTLGISLDRYLGADCEYYPRLEIYNYIAARMTPENAVPDAMYGWGASEWDFASMKYKADNVLSEMIHYGKLKYFEKCMMPDIPDELLFGFTPGQVKFCRNNEDRMWLYLVEHDLLFSTDQFTIQKLTGEAPFTSFFTNESPGRAAIWIGFRIVESYMMKNPGISLKEIMDQTDVQTILEKARYSPQ